MVYTINCKHLSINICVCTCTCVADAQLKEKEINIEIILHVCSTSAPTEGWELDHSKTAGQKKWDCIDITFEVTFIYLYIHICITINEQINKRTKDMQLKWHYCEWQSQENTIFITNDACIHKSDYEDILTGRWREVNQGTDDKPSIHEDRPSLQWLTPCCWCSWSLKEQTVWFELHTHLGLHWTNPLICSNSKFNQNVSISDTSLCYCNSCNLTSAI